MSDRIARKVWTSGLPKQIKPLAALLAGLARDDGRRIFASVAYMARALDCSGRTIQRQLRALRQLGVLVIELNGRNCGGRGHATRYRFMEANLPARNHDILSPFMSHMGDTQMSHMGDSQAVTLRLRVENLVDDRAREASPVEIPQRKPSRRSAPTWRAARSAAELIEARTQPNRMLEAIQAVDRAMLTERLSFTEAVALMRSKAEFTDRCPDDDFLPVVLDYFRHRRGLELQEARRA